MSYKKMNLIAKLVRWKTAHDSLTLLQFTPKKWAWILYKAVKSAIANAVNNWKFDEQQLFVEHILVGRWPKLKRMKFASRSRMHQYVHHRSYVKVILWVN